MNDSHGTRRGGGRTAVIVAGALVVPIAVALLIGGGALVAAHQTQRDDSGFYSTTGPPLTTPTHALVSDRIDVGEGGSSWLFRKSRLGTIKVSATGTRSKPIFVGVAPAAQVESFLRGTAYDRVSDFEVDPLSVTLDRTTGTAPPTAPTTQEFWASRASGTGTQSVTWPVQQGEWDVVVMNADGSAGVTTDVTVGARAGFIVWLGAGMLIAGAVLLTGAGTAIVLGARGPRRREPAA